MILRGNSVPGAPIVPWHPLRRVYGHFRRMPEQLRQVVERIGLIQLAGVDQAHVEIAYARSVHRLMEERILAMQNSLLQCGQRRCEIDDATLASTEAGARCLDL